MHPSTLKVSAVLGGTSSTFEPGLLALFDLSLAPTGYCARTRQGRSLATPRRPAWKSVRQTSRPWIRMPGLSHLWWQCSPGACMKMVQHMQCPGADPFACRSRSLIRQRTAQQWPSMFSSEATVPASLPESFFILRGLGHSMPGLNVLPDIIFMHHSSMASQWLSLGSTCRIPTPPR
ncbi:hypothetical protein F5883DRAFT_13108 [Diaporthe sp. PMI_573]|nr:hypothetical protein F5883DRAFT_13108 [Diaporthaceae sp. PMI_573]